jgi:hypothetical protein
MVEPQKRSPGRPKGQGRISKTAVAIKGSQEWKEWLDEFAGHCRLGLADTIEQSLIRYAEELGFERPPKR